MDIDMEDAFTEQPTSKTTPTTTANTITVEDSTPFDLESYISSYTGESSATAVLTGGWSY